MSQMKLVNIFFVLVPYREVFYSVELDIHPPDRLSISSSVKPEAHR